MVYQAIATLHMAGRAQANGDDVLAPLFQAEGFIEFGHLVDLDGRDFHSFCDPFEGISRQVLIFVLDG